MANSKILEQKQMIIDEIKDRVNSSKSVVLFDYHGVTDADIKDLRTKLREAGADFKVYKNTLMNRAFNDMDIDQIAPIKVLSTFAKDHPSLVMKVGLVDGEKADSAALSEYATLPSREGLLTMLAGGMIGIVRDLSISLDLYSQQKEEN